MVYQYTEPNWAFPKKERIWQVPYVQKRHRTSPNFFTKPKVKRTFTIVTKADGSKYLWEYHYKKKVLVIPLPKDVDMEKLSLFIRENTQ